MEEVTVSLMDLIAIGGVLLSIAGGFFYTRFKVDQLTAENARIEATGLSENIRIEKAVDKELSRIEESGKEAVLMLNGRINNFKKEVKESNNTLMKSIAELNNELNRIEVKIEASKTEIIAAVSNLNSKK